MREISLMRVIDRIANLILEDPLITAGRIAHKLGYAEEKTVYYWLHKSHFAGLNAFKKAVLHGQYLPHDDALEETPGLYARLPVADTFQDDGAPIFLGETLAVPSGVPAELIWRYSGPPVPNILPRDLLVLSRFEPVHSSRWVVARADTGMTLRIAVLYNGHSIALDPVTMERDNQCRVLYQILQLIRHY